MAQIVRAYDGVWEMINDVETHNSEYKILFGLCDLNFMRS